MEIEMVDGEHEKANGATQHGKESMMEKLKCENCAFWIQDEGKSPEPKYGVCKRYPPVWIGKSRDFRTESAFPFVAANELCGEYERGE